MITSSEEVVSIKTIYCDGAYSGWPTVARSNRTGRIFVVFSGGRARHVCPFGKIMMIVSDDDGSSWSPARVLYDGPLDDRDAGVMVTSQGSVLVSWFNSVCYNHYLEKGWNGLDNLPQLEARNWKERFKATSEKYLRRELGCWIMRSEDNGETFSNKVPSIANSPHGPLEVSDGRILYVGKLRDDIVQYADSRKGSPHSGRLGVSQSVDDGRSWETLCEGLPVAHEDRAKHYHEYHAVEAPDGKIIAQLRNQNKPEGQPFETLQMESWDGGRTWSVPHLIGVKGFPSHLMKLTDGRILMSYSHRYEPLGNFARISEDNGVSWSEPFLFGSAELPDMGYPSSVELPDGQILSVWYEGLANETQAVLRAAKWRPRRDRLC